MLTYAACLFQARIVGAKLAFASLERARLIFCDGHPNHPKETVDKRRMGDLNKGDLNNKQLAELLNEMEVQGLTQAVSRQNYERVVTQAEKDEHELIIKKWRDDLMKERVGCRGETEQSDPGC